MSVAVSCNLADGVILGVDSAISLPDAQDPRRIAKVYENAQKIFRLGKKPVGVGVFGLGNLGVRTVGSYIREFESEDPEGTVTGDKSVAALVEELRKYFSRVYMETVAPFLESVQGQKFDKISLDKIPILGLVVGGFSAGNYLSEVWQVLIPIHKEPNSATQERAPGNFGSNWFALHEPIYRYFKGYDRQLVDRLKSFVVNMLGRPMTAEQQNAFDGILASAEYPVPFMAMPMAEGVKLVKFLVEMVINHHRFAIGAPVVGGRAKIGLVTYKRKQFEFLEIDHDDDAIQVGGEFGV